MSQADNRTPHERGHMKFVRILAIALSLILQSCSSYYTRGHLRLPASAMDTERLEYLLHIDRFHFYLSHLWLHLDGKASREVVEAIQAITPHQIEEAGFSTKELSDAMNYDSLLARMKPGLKVDGKPIKWDYNFLKRKLNEAFTLKESRLSLESSLDDVEAIQDVRSEPIGSSLEAKAVTQEEMTLDSGKYISDRTTRAAFWEATESGRTVEFHLGDSRDFLHVVKQNGAEVLDEIRPMARNYNKIFLVQYPGESQPRLAITNIGGIDRLEHMLYHFNLENYAGGDLTNQIVVRGDIEAYHRKMTTKYKTMLEYLPKPKRVVMGQLGAIQGLFSVFEGFNKLSFAKDQSPALLGKLGKAEREKLMALFNKEDIGPTDIMANKSIIQKSEAALRDELNQLVAGKNLSSFKDFNYEDNLLTLSDLVFKNKNGEEIRWRLVSNVWGDEVVPISRALNELGQDNVTYMGTAGALPDSGLKVGDLYVPEKVSAGQVAANGYTPSSMIHNPAVNKSPMNVNGAVKGGAVDHVSSPFQESKTWLTNAINNGEVRAVEIETSYLAEIFKGPKAKLEIYLLISDVLGSEGETLATASSSKRKRSLEKLLNALLTRDKAGVPTQIAASTDEVLPASARKVLEEALGDKNALYRYHVYAMAEREGKNPSAAQIKEAIEETSSQKFSDKYIQKKLYEAGELIEAIYQSLDETGSLRPSISIPKDFIEGAWNPKSERLEISFVAQTQQELDIINEAVEKFKGKKSSLDSWLTYEATQRNSLPEGRVNIAPHVTPTRDVLIDAMADRAYKKIGLMKSVYEPTGSVSYSFLPTVKSAEVCEIGSGDFCQIAYFEANEKTKELADRVQNINLESMRNLFDQTVSKLNTQMNSRGEDERWIGKVKKVMVNNLPEGRLAQITPIFSETDGIVFEVRMTAEGWSKPLVILEELAHLTQMAPDAYNSDANSFFKHPLYFASVSQGALKGSKRSEAQLLAAEVHVQENMRAILSTRGELSSEASAYLDARSEHAASNLKSLQKSLKAENKLRKNLAAQFNGLQKELESEALKLDDYIAKNDRAKVAELVSSFLPWEDMEPTEISAWNTWINAIKRPASQVSDANKTLLFRGLEGDNIRRSVDGGWFLMSSMLNKNQGNYTRRLRSLKTYRDKLNGKANRAIPYEVGSLVNSLKGHSNEPLGSPFISTSVLSIAERFKGYGDESALAALHIPNDRFFGNLVSDYREFEKLIPLIIFPDEIVHVAQGTEEVADFRADVKAKIGRTINPKEINSTALDRLTETRTWWSLIEAGSLNAGNVPETCQGIMTHFIENTL